jgi:hypothetical protein
MHVQREALERRQLVGHFQLHLVTLLHTNGGTRKLSIGCTEIYQTEATQSRPDVKFTKDTRHRFTCEDETAEAIGLQEGIPNR